MTSKALWIVLSTMLMTVGCVVETASDEAAEEVGTDGFVSIFDGQTLERWRALPAETAGAWTVSEGMIVGDGDKGQGYLTFENGEIADLEIKLSYRFPGKGNSGIS